LARAAVQRAQIWGGCEKERVSERGAKGKKVKQEKPSRKSKEKKNSYRGENTRIWEVLESEGPLGGNGGRGL